MTPYPAPAASGVAIAPSAPAAPPTAEEKPKDSNPVVAFFKNPASAFSAFSWSGKDSETKAKEESVAKPSTGATPQPAEPRTPSIASQVPAVAPPAATDIYGTMPVGLEGYCPVTLVEKSTWVEGRPQWGARHRGRTYLFAGPAEQQAFLTAPDRYGPALSGDDPVLALDSGRQVPGQRRYGVTYQSRIYLFSSPETRAAFTTAPDRYTTRVMVAENPQMGSPSVIR
jgi:YHS domain-containing protein